MRSGALAADSIETGYSFLLERKKLQSLPTGRPDALASNSPEHQRTNRKVSPAVNQYCRSVCFVL